MKPVPPCPVNGKWDEVAQATSLLLRVYTGGFFEPIRCHKSMKRFLALCSLLTLLPLALGAASKTTVVLHPGDVLYARFENTGKKIRLAGVNKEADAQAQAVFSLLRSEDGTALTLKIENRFDRDLVYKAELRSLTIQRETQARVAPVVAGKLGFETFPSLVEEVVLYDFRLQK
jgi:hypothetical protein